MNGMISFICFKREDMAILITLSDYNSVSKTFDFLGQRRINVSLNIAPERMTILAIE